MTFDGGQGAYTAIKQCLPTSRIQRGTVHIQRHIRRQTTTRPRTDAGKAIYALASEDLVAEVAKLRRENQELRDTNELLKAASAFFASELDSKRRK